MNFTTFPTEKSRPKHYSAAAVCGIAAILLASNALAGWLFHVRLMVQIVPGPWAMVISTAVCCLILGFGLLVGKFFSRQIAVRTLSVVGSLVIFLAALALMENLLGLNLGLDFPQLHSALIPEYIPPGRMGPNVAVSLLLLGFNSLLYSFRRPERLVVVARSALAAVFALSVIGILTQWLDFRDLYPWFEFAGFSRISPLTSICTLLLGMGQWALWTEAAGLVWNDERIEAMRILQTAAVILIATALTTGVTGVALWQSRLMDAMKENLGQVGRDRLASFEQALVQRVDRAALLTNQEAIIWELRDFARSPANEADAARLHDSAQALLKHGFLAVAFHTTTQRQIQAGNMITDPTVALPIQADYPARLLWKQGYFLETRVPMADEAGIYGYVVSQQRLFTLDRLTDETNHWGRTGEMLVCAPNGADLSCFPSRTEPNPFQIKQASSKSALPIVEAVRGAHGAGVATDMHERRVFVAYGPVGTTGLGIAIKMETSEVLEPIRFRLEIASPLIALLVLAGLWGMQRRVKPLIRKLVASQEYIRHLATHDALTGLPNRVLLEDRLEVALRYASRNSEQVALVMVDLDHFKSVNDTLGHAIGDQLLQQVAHRLRRAIRASDTAARFGGDEFLLLLTRTHHPEGSSAVAAKVLEILSQPVILETCTVSVTPSIGIACYPDDGIDMRILLRHADTAMYAAKYGGRNGFRIYRPDVMMDVQPEAESAGEML